MTQFQGYPITYWYGIPAKYIRHEDGSIAVERIEEIKEAGFNLITASYNVAINKQVLDVAAKLGLRVTVEDSRVYEAFRDTGKRADILKAITDDYKDYPALFGYHITDEPNSAAFPELADIRRILAGFDPDHEAYINLFPNYANSEQLGNPTYYDHVKEFIEKVNPEIISYDHYHFIKGEPIEKQNFENERDRLIYEAAFSGAGNGYKCVDRKGFFDNIYEVRELSLKSGIPFMVIILVVEHGPYRNLSEAELRWEVWQALAYGSSRISYFTYWTPGSEDGDDVWHWRNGMIAKNGTRTPHYDMIKNINRELSAVGNILSGCKSLAVFQTGDMRSEKSEDWNGSFGGIDGVKGDSLTLGFFEGGYLLLANRNYKESADAELITSDGLDIYDSESDEWIEVDAQSGAYSFEIEAGDAVLLRITKKIL